MFKEEIGNILVKEVFIFGVVESKINLEEVVRGSLLYFLYIRINRFFFINKYRGWG